MNLDLIKLAQALERARTPEEVFGGDNLPQEERAKAVRSAYHRLARIAHPDRYQEPDDRVLAGRTFQVLTEWLRAANAFLAAQAYGNPEHRVRKVTVKTQRREYQVDVAYTVDGIYNAYPCQYRNLGRPCTSILKVVRRPVDNDLAVHEAQILETLRRGWMARKFSPYLPRLIEAFAYLRGGLPLQALVLEAETGWYSLEEVRAAYPSGVNPKDMAWIWRRLLVVLGYAHARGFLHLAVLPGNIWIQPELHGLQLRSWTHALNLRVDPTRPMHRIDPARLHWYPARAGTQPSTRMDIVMGAKSMLYL